MRELISTDVFPMTARLLIKHHPKLPTFYLLPKIHIFNTPGRPIVSACSCPTEHISEYLDAVLQPLVQSLPTYIKDSTHALNLIEDINQTPNFEPKYLFTMDVTSLYTCIPHSDGLKALKHFVVARRAQSSANSSSVMSSLMVFVRARRCRRLNTSVRKRM